MKKLLLFFLIFTFGCISTGLEKRVEILEQDIQMLQAMGVGAATRMYGRDCIDTGTCAKSLTAVSGAVDGDKAGVWISDGIYAFYVYDDDSGLTEDQPRIVDDGSAGSPAAARWILIEAYIAGNLQFSVLAPEDLPTHGNRNTQSFLLWYNDTGLTLNIEEVYYQCDQTGYAFDLYESTSSTDIGITGQSRLDNDSFTCSSGAASSGYYGQTLAAAMNDTAIANNKYLIFGHTTGTATDTEVVHIYVKGYLN